MLLTKYHYTVVFDQGGDIYIYVYVNFCSQNFYTFRVKYMDICITIIMYGIITQYGSTVYVMFMFH